MKLAYVVPSREYDVREGWEVAEAIFNRCLNDQTFIPPKIIAHTANYSAEKRIYGYANDIKKLMESRK